MPADVSTDENLPAKATHDAVPRPDELPLPDAADADEASYEPEWVGGRPRPEVDGKPFGIRAWAYVIDAVVLNVVAFAGGTAGLTAFALLLAAAGRPLAPVPAQSDLALIRLIESVIATLFYFALFEWLFGASPGKVILGLRVVREDGGRPGLWPVIVRDLFRLFDGLVFGLPAYLAMEKHRSHQRIGDRRAGTLVVGHRDPIVKDRPPWGWFSVAALVAVPVLSVSTMAMTIPDFRVSQPPVAALAADINLDESDFDGPVTLALSQGKESDSDASYRDVSVRVFVDDETTVESRVMVLSFMPADTVEQVMMPLLKSLAEEGLGRELAFGPVEAVAVGDRAGIVRFDGVDGGREGYALMFIRRNVMGRLIVLAAPGALSPEDVLRLAQAMDGDIR